MSRLVITDSTLCTGYHTCKAACSEACRQHGLRSVPRLRVVLNEKESVPQLCHHREDAPYMVVCPVNAVTHVDDTVWLNESLRVSYKLCGITYSSDTIEFSGSCSLDIPAGINTPKAPSVPPVPAHVSTLFDWVLGTRTIAIKCNLRNFDE